MHTRENLKLRYKSKNSKILFFFFLHFPIYPRDFYVFGQFAYITDQMFQLYYVSLHDFFDGSSCRCDVFAIRFSGLIFSPSLISPLQKASVMSIMAAWDWPEKWPGLVENLTACLSSDDMNLVHGAMKTLDMFASGQNLTDVHIPLLVEIVFPQLQRIFGEQQYPERIRMRAIRILCSIITWLGTIKAEYPKPIAAAIKPTLPLWYELFHYELSKPDTFGSGHGSKTGVLQVIYQLLAHFPEYLQLKIVSSDGTSSTAVSLLLEPLWQSLQSAVDIWERTSVYGTELDESGYDSDAGDEISFKNYLCMLVEVFTVLDEKRKFQPLLTPGIVQLFYIVIRLVQLSDVQSQLFTDDPSQFLIDEDEENLLNFSLRGQASRLLQILAVSLEGHGIEAMGSAVHTHLEELSAMEAIISGNAPLPTETYESMESLSAIYHRRREALLFGVGTALKSWSMDATELGGASSVSDVPFDVDGIIKLLLADCESNDLILRGRALWCASIALRMLPDSVVIAESEERPESSDETTAFLVRTATTALQTPEAPLPFLLQAATCLTQLSCLLDEATLKETISVALPLLASLAPELTEASLGNVLSTIERWIELDAESTVNSAGLVLDYVLQSWSLNAKDPYVPALISCIVGRLSAIPQALPVTQQKVGDVVRDVFADPASRDNGLVEACTEVLGHLFMDAPWPLPPLFTDDLIPQLFSLMLHTNDNAMLQVGCTTLVALVRCAKENLANFNISISTADHSSQEPVNSLEALLMVIDRVLNAPELDDHSALFVGPLISKLIDNCGSVLGSDRVNNLLQMVVLRLERVELNSLIQDLLLIFALLMRQDLDLVLQFLTSFNMPSTGEPALHYVLSFWTKTFEDRRGNYQLKVSVLALSSIFGHPALTDVVVPADAAIEDALASKEEAIGYRTRSRQKINPAIPRTEPLNTRIFRLLIREHMWLLEENDAPADMGSDDDDFGAMDPNEIEDSGPFADANDFDDYLTGTVSLDRLLQNNMGLDDEETDPDILNDPAYSLDLTQYIYDWMKDLATKQVDLFDYCVSQLSSREKNHLIDRLIKSGEE